MKTLLEKILGVLQSLVIDITSALEQYAANEHNEALGKALVNALAHNHDVRRMFCPDGNVNNLKPEHVNDMLDKLNEYEDKFSDYDPDDLVNLWDEIVNETEYDPCMSISEIVDALNSGLSESDRTEIKDAVDTLHNITSNW